MSIRGTEAIVGFAEIPTRRNYPGRTALSLMAEAPLQSIRDAGLRKEDIDGIIMPEGTNALTFGEYIEVHHAYNAGMTVHGTRGAISIPTAAAAINAGSVAGGGPASRADLNTQIRLGDRRREWALPGGGPNCFAGLWARKAPRRL